MDTVEFNQSAYADQLINQGLDALQAHVEAYMKSVELTGTGDSTIPIYLQ